MPKHIVFVGGGTAGHIAPLLAVLEAVKDIDPQTQCTYIGRKADVASKLISESKLSFKRHTIAAGKLNRHFTIRQVGQPFLVMAGYAKAYYLLRRLKPDVIFSKGGFVSVPVVMAADHLNIPVVSHETDVIPGLANRLVAKTARIICTAFPVNAYKTLPEDKLCYTGQPVRSVFFEKPSESLVINNREVHLNEPLITITGAVQGARKINEYISALWPQLLEKAQVVHQCGWLDFDMLTKAQEKLPKELCEKLWIVPVFGDTLATLFQKSSIVISRSGGTIAELAAAHAACILIPLSTASQNHQYANAEVLEAAGAARVFNEMTGSTDELWNMVDDLLRNESERNKLKKAIAGFSQPNAAHEIAHLLFKVTRVLNN